MGRCYRSIMPVSTDHRPADRARRRRTSELVAEDLLDAALVEFVAHGFDGASTRAIAARAGWHQPQINYHFAVRGSCSGGRPSTGSSPSWAPPSTPTRSILSTPIRGRGLPCWGAPLRPVLRGPPGAVPHHEPRVDLRLGPPRLARRPPHPRSVRTRGGRVPGAVRAAGAGADLPVADVYQLLIGHGASVFAEPALPEEVRGHRPDRRWLRGCARRAPPRPLLPPGPSAPTRSR